VFRNPDDGPGYHIELKTLTPEAPRPLASGTGCVRMGRQTFEMDILVFLKTIKKTKKTIKKTIR
jgi:hypothetical protein